MNELSFPVSSDNDELMQTILEFDQKKYEQDVSEFMKHVDNEEDGRGSKRGIELINKWRKNKIKLSVTLLIYNIEFY